MRIKELVDLTNIGRLAPIHFHSEISKEMISFCKHLTKQESEDYKNNLWTIEKKYDDSELGIYLPDVSVEELYNIEMTRNPVAVSKVINDISYLLPVKISEFALVYSLYAVLHEVGHWLYFKSSGKTCLEYALWDSRFRKEPMEYSEKVRSISDSSIYKKIYAEKAVELYNDIPSEKEADMYACENIEQKFELVKNYK